MKFAIEERHVSIRGYDIFTKQILAGSTERQNCVMVFLHDGLGSTNSWGSLPLQLASELGINALLYDRRGYGQSSAFTFSGNIDYLKDEAMYILPELLDKFNVQFPIFIGHSDGATIALIFSGIYSHVKSLVVSIAAHSFVEPITIEGIKVLIDNFNDGKLREKLYKQHLDKTDPLFASWTSTWLGKEFATYNIFDYLKSIKSPMLLMQGDKDEFGTMSQIDSICELSDAPKDVFIIENCKHSPHITHQAVVLDKCKNFILDKLR